MQKPTWRIDGKTLTWGTTDQNIQVASSQAQQLPERRSIYFFDGLAVGGHRWMVMPECVNRFGHPVVGVLALIASLLKSLRDAPGTAKEINRGKRSQIWSDGRLRRDKSEFFIFFRLFIFHFRFHFHCSNIQWFDDKRQIFMPSKIFALTARHHRFHQCIRRNAEVLV